jgi:hypothetical protein
MAAVTGFVGSFGSGMLAGDSFKASLRGGLTSAALAGGISAISGGSAALQERPEMLDTFEKRGFFGTVKDTTKNFFGSPVDETKRLFGVEGTASQQAVPEISDATTLARTPAERFVGAGEGTAIRPDGVTTRVLDPQTISQADIVMPDASRVVPMTADATFTPPSQDVLNFKPDYSISTGAAATPVTSITGLTSGAGTSIPGGAERGFFDKTIDFFSPGAREAAGKKVALNEFSKVLAETGSEKLAEEAYRAAMPGTVSKYLPMAALGIGTLTATGAIGSPFEEPETEVPNIQQDYFKDVMAARERVGEEYPSFFGSLAPASYPTQTVQNIYTPPTDYTTRPNIPIRTYQAAKGSGPEGVEDFPRKTGPISGPGTGTSDDIPAMLSDGEFVFTAKAVRNMGGGSRRKGAAKMYKLMKMLEGGPVDKTARA